MISPMPHLSATVPQWRIIKLPTPRLLAAESTARFATKAKDLTAACFGPVRARFENKGALGYSSMGSATICAVPTTSLLSWRTATTSDACAPGGNEVPSSHMVSSLEYLRAGGSLGTSTFQDVSQPACCSVRACSLQWNTLPRRSATASLSSSVASRMTTGTTSSPFESEIKLVNRGDTGGSSVWVPAPASSSDSTTFTTCTLPRPCRATRVLTCRASLLALRRWGSRAFARLCGCCATSRLPLVTTKAWWGTMWLRRHWPGLGAAHAVRMLWAAVGRIGGCIV
mmetsp:Transcript_2071/g.7412  ORF Transcript_2071/g.7412 Transcript_2071/m.7412 type:complete len:284 (+) Transcript_2071:299-1150(+)